MKLTLNSFRGATKPFGLNLNKADRLTILFGENGTGKSTIVDGFDFLFKGTAGSLTNKSLDGKSALPSLASLGATPANVLVAWEENSKTTTATIAKGKPQRGGDSLQTKLRTLRRSDLAGLLEDTPANKYKHIQSFVELERLEAQEIALLEIVKKAKSALPTWQQQAERAEAELRRLQQEHPRPTKQEPVAWARSQSSPPSQGDKIAYTKWQKIFSAMSELMMTEYSFESADELLKKSVTALNDAKATQQSTAQAFASNLADSLPLLEAAQSFLVKHSESDVCPLCLQPKNQAELAAEIAEKLKSLAILRSCQQAVTQATLEHSHAERQLSAARKKLSSDLRSFEKIHGEVAGDINAAPLPAYVSEGSGKEPDGLDASYFTARDAQVSAYEKLSDQALRFINDYDTKETYRRALETNLKSYDQASEEFTRYSYVIDQGEKVREVLRSSRVEYAVEALRQVEGEIARLYSSIHPGEHLENIRLMMHPDRRGSLEIKGSAFSEENIPPQAYYSESHLDTLALCIFIALEKKAGAENTLFLVDDAISSVDEAHLERLYDLLLEEATHFKHVIITSHYQPLRHKWKWGRLTQSKARLIELAPWTQEGGLSVQKGCENEIALLRRRLAEGDDASGIAGKSGIILEHLLDYLSGIYAWNLPRLTGPGRGWTLDQYLSRVPTRLAPVLRAEHFADGAETPVKVIEIGPLLADIRSIFHTRNIIGAHYNELAAQFNSLAEAMDLGRKTLALAEALTSPDGELPTCRRNGSCWKIRGSEILRLHPLTVPS
jgi:hypothetical protein